MIDCFQRKLENNDYENIENFNYRLYIRVLQSLALLIGVIKLIKKHVNLENKDEDNFVSLEEIDNFKKVLEEVGELAASIFLESEIEKQKMVSIEMENSRKGSGINNQKSVHFGSKERNFFAHAGLEKTMIIKEGNKIKYKDEIIEELKDCLVKGRGEIFSWLVKRFLI
jgi:CRISPR/Cas system-associated protein Csx1